jgi:hypothetical protein
MAGMAATAGIDAGGRWRVAAADAQHRLRVAAGHLSPPGRRWRRFLRSLPLDLDHLAGPLAEPGPRDFVICGCPRTGTTLLAAALFQPPRVVTVMEPWDGLRLLPAELFASLRHELDTTGRLTRGRLDTEALTRDGAVRWCTEGQATIVADPQSGYLLGVKWPVFWRYLGLLPTTRFVVCVRHPFEVVRSFRQAGGRVGSGLQYDTRLNRSMNRELRSATRDLAVRRVLLYDYVHERVLPHLGRDNVFVVRFERWFEEPERLLGELSDFLGTDVRHSPARVAAPRASTPLSPYEIEVVRRRCRTAAALGYSLDDRPRPVAAPS